MFGIFQEYQSWVTLMGVPTIGAVNARTLAGDAGGMIKLAEAFHERKFAWVADTIYEAAVNRGIRMVLISGPSSSGKTTSAKRLGIELGVLGLRPVMISLDDYFVDREKTPKDANGDYDYEALEAIDLELFNGPNPSTTCFSHFTKEPAISIPLWHCAIRPMKSAGITALAN